MVKTEVDKLVNVIIKVVLKLEKKNILFLYHVSSCSSSSFILYKPIEIFKLKHHVFVAVLLQIQIEIF